MPIDDGLLRRLRATPEERIVAELKRVYERRGREPRRSKAPTVPDGNDDDHYEHARRVFAREEQRLRRQVSVVDEIVGELRRKDQERETAPHTSQETLFLRAAAGRPAAGRFRLANHFARSVTVDLDAAGLHTRAGVAIACPIDVRPARVRLEPGDSCEVRVRYDLGEADPAVAAGEVLEAEIVAEAHEACLHRLWVEIEVYP